MIKRFACFRIHGKRPGRSITSTQDVGANNKIPARIKESAFIKQPAPPIGEI
jgi:hypothetical protein